MQSQYSKLQLLGEGGMGKVYLAKDNKLQRQVAIKELKALSEQQGVENALSEAQILARVSHGNIIQIYNTYEEDNQAALVMEYFHSRSLTQFQTENQLSLIEKIELLMQLAAGLQAAHQNNVIHCDLKPSNILINNQRQLKIADFGIARLANNEQGSAEVNTGDYGCLNYMSPEQIKGEVVDYRTDIFSFGLVAYQLLLGSHPFGNSSGADVAQRICTQSAEHLRNLLLDAPEQLTNLVMLMLAKSPEQRTLTAAEIENRLHHILVQLQQSLASEQVTLPLPDTLNLSETTLEPRLQQTPQRNKLSRVGIISSVCLLCALVFLVITFLSDKPSQYRQIVVLKPTIVDSADMAEMQQDLVLSTVEDAMRQAVINTEKMYLISQREVKATSAIFADDLAKLKQALGASDLITTELNCDSARCKVSYSRLTANPNKPQSLVVSAEKNWLLPIDKFSVIYSVSQTQFASLFPKPMAVNQSGLVQKPITEQDYLSYIALYNQIKGQGQYSEQSLTKLAELLMRAPYLYAAYALYRDTALDLYLDSRDKKYLNQLDTILQNAPPEYRYSVYEAIDRFWLSSDLGQPELAQQQIEEAKQRGADDLLILEHQAYMYFSSGEYEQAAKAYSNAYKLRPSLSLLYNTAFSYWRLGELGKAEGILEDLLVNYPSNKHALLLRANIYLLTGNVQPAISSYEQIVSKERTSLNYSNLALAYALNKQYGKSLEYAELAVQLNPKHSTWLSNLADVNMILGNVAQAKELYKQVNTLSGDKSQYRYWLDVSQAQLHLGYANKAVDALAEAKKIAPDNGEVAYTAALIYSVLGEHVSAIFEVKKALKNKVGAVWFNLPWFNALCDTNNFEKLMANYNNANRCKAN